MSKSKNILPDGVKNKHIETLTIREQLHEECGQLLTQVQPTLKLKDLSVGELYKLPADVKNVTRLLLEIKGEFCILKTLCDKEILKNHFKFYEVHYTWLRIHDYE